MTTILLHPIGLDRTTWQSVGIPDFLAIDLPGHGAAPLDGVRTLEDVADAVANQLDPGDPVDVVGISLGAMVGVQLALRHPAKVRSLVAACAPAATPTEIMLQRASDTERLAMSGVAPSIIDRWFTERFIESDQSTVEQVRQQLLADNPATVALYWRMLAGFDVRSELDDLDLPVTVIAGASDISTSPAMAKVLADLIPGARYSELPGPHMLHLEEPALFAAEVGRHLDAARAAPAGRTS